MREVPRIHNGLLKLAVKSLVEELDTEEEAVLNGTPLSTDNPAVEYAGRVGMIKGLWRAIEIMAEVETKAIEESRR